MNVQSNDPGVPAAGSDGIQQTSRPRFARQANRIFALGVFGLLLGGGSSTPLFQSSFNSNAANSPPSPNQATGTVSVAGEQGGVVVVPAPANAGSEQWVRISRRSAEGSPISTMQANLSQLRGAGTYGLLAVLYIPKGSGWATIEFDTLSFGPTPLRFLHLDFANNFQNTVNVFQNWVRVNDDPHTDFGTFPYNTPFTVAVTLTINGTSPVAHVQLFGAGASGAADIPLTPADFAQLFGAMQFYMGAPWTGSFDVTDIILTYH